MAQHPIGLGTYLMTKNSENNNNEIISSIRSAIQLGYRRIDCAPVYFNEDAVGDALFSAVQDGLVASRSDLFVVSKLASPFHRQEHVGLALRKTLSDLRLDYLDLFLIHWPVAFHYVDINNNDPSVRGWDNEDIDDSDNGKNIDPTVSIHETWQAMEALVDQGLVKYIGVSNFPVSLLHELLTRARIPPAINQVEAHPYLSQSKLLAYCQARNVHFQAYSPLGTPGYKESHEPVVLDDPVIQQLARQYNVTPSQICLAWALQRGTSVVVKSMNPQHQRDNLAVVTGPDLQLSHADMERINALDRNYRFFRPEDWWGDMAMAVFH